MNFGHPFLSPALRLVLPDGTTTTPRNEDAAAGLGRERTFCAPVDGAAEQVFFHKVPGEDGFGQVRAENPELGFGAEVRWSLGSLPVLAQWKCMRSGEYVLGIEPSTPISWAARQSAKTVRSAILRPLKAGGWKSGCASTHSEAQIA